MRLLGKVLLWAIGLIALTALALAISIWVDGRGAEERLAAVANASVPGVSGPDVAAYVARPESRTPAPAVVMVHEFWGLNEDIQEKADLLAREEGYIVVAPDVMRGKTTGWLPSAIYQVSATDPSAINDDLDAVAEWARQQPDIDPERIAIVGFCFGGRSAMLYSLHDPTLDGTVVFYGNPVMDAERLKALSGPVLGIFGADDRSIPQEDVDAFAAALDQAGVESTVTVYPGEGHAFVSSVEAIEAGGAPGQAWGEMTAFLRDVFSRAPSSAAPAGMPQRANDPLGWSYIMRLGLSHAGMTHTGNEHSSEGRR